MKENKGLRWFSLILGASLLALPFVGSSISEDSHWIFSFGGKWHPLFVHLPIGLLLGVFLLETYERFSKNVQIGAANTALLWMSVLFSIPTVLAGFFLSQTESYGSDTLVFHQWLGIATVIGSLLLLNIKTSAPSEKTAKFSSPYYLLLCGEIVLLSITGHLGGSLTHGSTYLTEDLPPQVQNMLGLSRTGEQLADMNQNQVSEILDTTNFENHISPIVNTYCVSCHGTEKQKGGFRIDQIDPDIINGTDADAWHHVLDMVNLGEMPPKDEKQFTPDERTAFVNWITASLHQAVELKKANQEIALRRLTKPQYSNTLSHLLDIPIDFGRKLPDDGKSEMGFSNNGEVLQVSTLHLQNYQDIAREALNKAIDPVEKPKGVHYRIKFGTNVGIDQKVDEIGGYQSAPIENEHFYVERLDENGEVIIPKTEEEKAHHQLMLDNLGIGMRGSSADRYSIVDSGIVLYSAVPHREVSPKSWQGPSPNLKFLMRRYFPDEGFFQFKVKARKGPFAQNTKQQFYELRKNEPLELETSQVLSIDAFETNKNLIKEGNILTPVVIPDMSRAETTFFVEKEGFYQFDFTHPFISMDNMPSFMFRIDDNKIQERMNFTEEDANKSEITTPITLMYLKQGEHKLGIGGNFFVGFQNVRMTYIPKEHQINKELEEELSKNEKLFSDADPVLRAFAGERTDDGMAYEVFDDKKVVLSSDKNTQTFVFEGRLEDLPIPDVDTTEREFTGNIMIVGLWNDYLIKDNSFSGPPVLIEEIEYKAPYIVEWPTASHKSIFIESKNKNKPEKYAYEVIENFMSKAYRFPVEKDEVDIYYQFWKDIQSQYPRFEDGIKEVLVAVLSSPKFIYLLDTEDPKKKVSKDYILASKLSYFLWNMPPDDELLKLASKGKLHKKRQLQKQVQRMIRDEKSMNMIEQFADEWLRLDRQKSMSTNVNKYRDFSRFVKRDMQLETYHFLRHLLLEDMSIQNMIHSDFMMLNQNLAEFYGISSVKGKDFRPVPIEGGYERGGLLTQGAFLNGHSDGSEPHAIKRAVWLKAKILGDEPAPPPPNVPELDPDTPGFEKLTLKEQLFMHRDNPSCMECHQKIDPFGIVFENYDAVGRYQMENKGKKIDASAELPDGEVVDGIEGIKNYILQEKPDHFTKSLVTHLYAYALGRDVTFVDDPEIKNIVQKVKQNNYSFQSVVENIVLSEAFTKTKKYPENGVQEASIK